MIRDMFFIIVFTCLTAGVGLAVVAKLDRELRFEPLARLALGFALGLGLTSLALLALGEIGRLDRVGMLAVAMLAAPFAATGWRRSERPALADLCSDRFCASLIAVALASTFAVALTPVTDGDALCYHLQVPKVFVSQAAVGFDPDLHETVYPLGTEMLFAAGLEFRGPAACKLIAWLHGVALFLCVTATARPFLGRRAAWAGVVAMLVPAVTNGMGAALNDVALAAFGNAAILAWSRLEDRLDARAAALLGLTLGLALGVKFPALVLAGLVALALVIRAAIDLFRSRSTETHVVSLNTSTRNLALVLIIAVLVGSPWYARAWRHTGNPVHPFFRSTFGGSGLDEVLDPIKRPLATTPLNLIAALGPLTLDPARFDSFSHQFGPVFLLCALGFLLERPRGKLLAIVALGYAFVVACMTQRQSMRFLLIAVGPLAIASAWTLDRLRARTSPPARAARVVLALALLFEAGLALSRTRHAARFVLGLESAESYLAAREPTFVVGRWIEAELPRAARVIGQDHRGFYIPRPYTMELARRRRTGLGTRGESPDDIVDVLVKSGYTHILFCPPATANAVEFDPALSIRLASWRSSREPLYKADLVDGDGVTRCYEIFALNDRGRDAVSERADAAARVAR